MGTQDDHQAPLVPWYVPLVMVRNRSCPAVSHICNLMDLLSRNIFLILKSMLYVQGGRCEEVHQERIARSAPYPMVVIKLD